MPAAVNGWRQTYHRWSTSLYGPSPVVTALSWIRDERGAIGCIPTAATIQRLVNLGVNLPCELPVVDADAAVVGPGTRDSAAELVTRHRAEAVLVPAWTASVEDWLVTYNDV
jgi:hypothetical protein